MANENQNVPAVNEERAKVTYLVAGQEVTLSYQIVRSFLTKGGGNVSDQDLTQFISICKYNQLNPFLNEAYLVKYGSAPAQMVVSKEALMKRADACEKYEGIQSGIIVVRDGNVEELEGCFMLSSDKLVGGWAKVYRSDRKYPIVARVSLVEYDKQQSTWKEKPSTMISKVAKVQALREAFPAQLGAMYTQEEQNIEDVAFEEVKEAEKKVKANSKEVSIPEEKPKNKTTEKVEPEVKAELQNIKIESIAKAKEMLINDLGVMESAIPNEKAIYEIAAEHGIKFIVEKTKGPGF